MAESTRLGLVRPVLTKPGPPQLLTWLESAPTQPNSAKSASDLAESAKINMG